MAAVEAENFEQAQFFNAMHQRVASKSIDGTTTATKVDAPHRADFSRSGQGSRHSLDRSFDQSLQPPPNPHLSRPDDIGDAIRLAHRSVCLSDRSPRG